MFSQDLLNAILNGKAKLDVRGSDSFGDASIAINRGETLQVHIDCMNAFGQIVSIDDVYDMDGVVRT